MKKIKLRSMLAVFTALVIGISLLLLRGAVRHRTVGYESGVPRLRAFGRVCARVLR